MHHVHHGRESSSHPGRAHRVSESPCWCGNRRHHLWLLESLHLNGSWRNWVDFTKQRKGTRFPADMISRGNAANESWWMLVCHGISDTLSSSWNCNLSSIELQFCHDLNIATSWDILAQMMTAIIIIYNSPRKSPGSALRNSILVLGIPEPKGTTWSNSEMSCSSKPAVRQGAPGISLPFLDVHLFTPDLHYTSLWSRLTTLTKRDPNRLSSGTSQGFVSRSRAKVPIPGHTKHHVDPCCTNGMLVVRPCRNW